MKLIVISSPTPIEKEHSILAALFKMGLEIFHLRKPALDFLEMEHYIAQIPIEYRNRIVIHSHHQLAIDYQLMGIHYTYKDPFDGKKLFPERIKKSTSIHSLEELKDLSPDFEYCFLSPIFDSISKENLKAKFEREELYLAMESKKDTPEVIALGGINEDTFFEALEIGFDGVAVLGDVWKDDNPVKKFKQLSEIKTAIIELDQLFDE